MKKNILLFLFLTNQLVFGQTLNIGEVNAKDYYEEVDFEFIINKIVVPVEINNRTYKFIIDTGAPNLISNELYELLNPKFIDTIPTYDGNDKKENLKIVSIEKLKLGNLEFFNTATLVQNFSPDNPLRCLGLDGFLGSNMLRNSIVQFDLKNKKVRITNDKKKLNIKKKNSSEIKLSKVQSNPYAIIDLIGKDKSREYVIIDTGMDGLYDLSKNNYKIFSQKNIFREIGKSSGSSSFSLFGSSQSGDQYKLLLPQMKINKFTVQDLITITGNHDNSRIGAELLKYGVLTIDYIDKRFYFEPTEDTVKIHHEDFGFSRTLSNGNLIVGFVWDDELKNKISNGDIILEINNKPFKVCELLTTKNNFKENKKLELKIEKSDGKVIKLIVEKKNYSQHRL